MAKPGESLAKDSVDNLSYLAVKSVIVVRSERTSLSFVVLCFKLNAIASAMIYYIAEYYDSLLTHNVMCVYP